MKCSCSNQIELDQTIKWERKNGKSYSIIKTYCRNCKELIRWVSSQNKAYRERDCVK